MPILRLTTEIHSPIQRVFDMSRSIDFHTASQTRHAETAVAGVTSGLIGPGESVTWQAKHFGLRQKLTSRITVFDPPHHFRDTLVQGAFARFDHDHFFVEQDSITTLRDVFDYDSPLGPLGRIADALFLARYMSDLLAERNRILKAACESEEWRHYLP